MLQPATFQKVMSFLDVRAACAELAAQPELWSEITIRQDYEGSAHHDTETIILRGPAAGSNPFDEIPAQPYAAMAKLPHCSGLCILLVEKLNAPEIGRVMAVRLKAGGVIDPHVDEGKYAEHYQRFHIVLQSEEGNVFQCGSRIQWMEAGTAWWFNHRLEHDVVNASTASRVHLIIDLVAPSFVAAQTA